MLDQRLAEHALAGGAGASDRLVGLSGRGVDDVERTPRHMGDHDRAVGRFALDRGRARIGVAFRPGHSGLEIMLLQAENDVAVLGVHQRHRAEAGAATERVIELVVVDHQRAFVRHVMLEGVDAVGLHAGFHLVEDLPVPPRHRHVEAVVAGRGLGLAPPVLVGREQRLAGVRDAEVDHHGGAARERRLGAPGEIVGRHRTHERKLEMGVGIDAARQNVATAGVDHLRPGRPVEIGTDRGDLAVADEHIGPPRVVVVDDRAAANEYHVMFPSSVPSRKLRDRTGSIASAIAKHAPAARRRLGRSAARSLTLHRTADRRLRSGTVSLLRHLWV